MPFARASRRGSSDALVIGGPKMRVVIAPDSYKGSLTAVEVADMIRDGFTSVSEQFQCHTLPMADGGEGTLDALMAATGGTRVSVRVTGPLGTPVQAAYGILPDGKTAVIEMAQAVGLPLMPSTDKNVLQASTYGVGTLINEALNRGCREFIVGLGGSATNDGGLGILVALGVTFWDEDGRTVACSADGMCRVARADVTGLDARLAKTHIVLACDVTNPLTGQSGASLVYGPQKGADASTARRLDEGLTRYAAIVESAFSQIGLNRQAGAGAAGGCGFALLALGASMKSGAGVIGEISGLYEAIRQSDLVITGEGRSDRQTLSGKAPFVVAQIAAECGKPTMLLSGSYDATCTELADHFSSIHASSCGPASLDEAMSRARESLLAVSQNLARCICTVSH